MSVEETIANSLPNLSRYRVLDQLGAGGMGEVYLAEDTKLRRNVALKVLPPDAVESPDAKQRLLREARAVANLDHPNICPVFEVGEVDGRSFIVMQYLEGELLSDIAKEEPLEMSRALRIATQVSDALAEAHRHGIVHRDIKPANIIIDRRGEARVLDFGVAKIQVNESDETLGATAPAPTAIGQVLGTVPYMAPEQLRGLEVDARSDLFSLGIVLYEMLTGEHPFSADTTPDTVVNILSRPHTPLAEIAPLLPQELDELVSKMLEKDPADRFQDAAELTAALHDLSQSLGLWSSSGLSTSGSVAGNARAVDAQAASLGPTPKPLNRRRLALGLIATGLALPIIVYALWKSSTGEPEASTAAPVQLRTVAVLPLVNNTGDDDLAYLTDGIAEGILNDLSRVSDLRVTSHASSFRYRNRQIAPSEIGRELAVQVLVTGRVRRQSEGLAISIDLIDTVADRQLWGAQYPANPDIDALRREISRELIANLRPPSARSAPLRQPLEAADPRAYEFYLRGNFHYNRFVRDAMDDAIANYRKALEISPNYALAYAALAKTYSLMAGNFLPVQEVIDEWRAATDRAIELDVGLADAHFSRARLLHRWEFDWEEAETSYRLALRLNPSLADAHTSYATLLWALQRFTEAEGHSRNAIDLDPFSIYHSLSLGIGFLMNRDFDRALEQFERTHELDRQFVTTLTNLSETHSFLGNHDEALEFAAQAERLAPESPAVLSNFGWVLSQAGEMHRARSYAERLVAMGNSVNPILAARVWAGLGEPDVAMQWLQRAVEQRHPWLYTLSFDPKFDSLRERDLFAEILRQLDLASHR